MSFRRDLSPTIVEIRVDHKTFTVHKDRLLEDSQWFRHLIEEEQKRGSGNAMRHEDLRQYRAPSGVSPIAFGSYMHWLYSGQVNVHGDQEAHTERDTAKLMMLYNIGRKLRSPELKMQVSEILEAVYRDTDCTPSITDLNLAYELLPESPLCGLLIDITCRTWNPVTASDGCINSMYCELDTRAKTELSSPPRLEISN